MKIPLFFRLLSLLLMVFLPAVASVAQDDVDTAGFATEPQNGVAYTISPLDYLKVALYVADEMQFQTEVRVSQSGMITVPHLGAVKVIDLTVEEMREELYQPYNHDFYVELRDLL